MSQDIPELDRKGLRDFGLLMGGFVAALFGLVFPWAMDYAWPWWPWAVAAAFVAWALLAAQSLRPLYRVWMRFGLAMGWVSTRVVLSVVFYLVIWPMAAVMRLRGRDPMHGRFDDAAASYREPTAARSKDHMKKPF